ncbi:MAG: DUF262 domain-containing protein [Firmicutes bacterium]|nr:DUF262 domain-containing protein [Bacillota bacterium]
MVKSNDTPLQDILKGIAAAKIQLPDFQRGWVWDDERICGLIASITSSYPVGALMFLEYNKDEVRFKSRTFTNVPESQQQPETLVLDGQQRLTSIFCAMYSQLPVPTEISKNRKAKQFYYIDIEKSLNSEFDRIDAIISVSEDRLIREDFGRVIVTDLSSREGEFAAHMFPLNLVFDSIALDEWQYEYQNFHSKDSEIVKRSWTFKKEVLYPILQYRLPIIELDRSTPKEAVCQVFENVNTGGVPLTIFELITATFAADDFGLREDWRVHSEKMLQADGTFDLLSVVAANDFLSAITLLAQQKKGKTLSAKRRDVLNLALADYKNHANALTDGFIRAARFIVQQGILTPKNLPYTTQFVPLSVLMTILGDRADDGVVREKLQIWYWCGIFGEMYGSANETRYASDISGVLAWLDGGEEPNTVNRAVFQPQRLLSLQTRNSAAYRGILALILNAGARDFISGDKMDFANYTATGVDIHHIFPKKHCENEGYLWQKWNSVVNKTPISYRTNRIIGGVAPSAYLANIEKNVSAEHLDENLRTHGIDVSALRADDFNGFFGLRARFLIGLIGQAMGKKVANLGSEEILEIFGVSLE